jgi:hypothetical protein
VVPASTFLVLDAAAATCLTARMTLRLIVVLSVVARAALPTAMTTLVIGAGGALHGARIVCSAMRCARAGCIRAVRCDARDAQADALRGSMRCELIAMQCTARGLVAFARCRRHHAF